MNTNYYKLIDTNTGETVSDHIYTLTDTELLIFNYAYGLNSTSKKLVVVE